MTNLKKYILAYFKAKPRKIGHDNKKTSKNKEKIAYTLKDKNILEFQCINKIVEYEVRMEKIFGSKSKSLKYKMKHHARDYKTMSASSNKNWKGHNLSQEQTR
ncbi:hypothetical protein ACJX0J_040534 [Zea mays]